MPKKSTCCQRIQSACETHTQIAAIFLQGQKDTSTFKRQSQIEPREDCTTRHPGGTTNASSVVCNGRKKSSTNARGTESYC